MYVYLYGHWGKMYPGENFLYEAELALSQWEKGALIFGSGQYLSSQDLFSRFGVTEILGENNFVESNPIFRPSENKLEVLGNICSDFENLVFVNTSSEAVAVSQKCEQI